MAGTIGPGGRGCNCKLPGSTPSKPNRVALHRLAKFVHFTIAAFCIESHCGIVHQNVNAVERPQCVRHDRCANGRVGDVAQCSDDLENCLLERFDTLTFSRFAPFFTHSSTTFIKSVSFRPDKLNLAPKLAKCAAIAAPIPLLAPVMIATRPFSFCAISELLLFIL